MSVPKEIVQSEPEEENRAVITGRGYIGEKAGDGFNEIGRNKVPGADCGIPQDLNIIVINKSEPQSVEVGQNRRRDNQQQFAGEVTHWCEAGVLTRLIWRMMGRGHCERSFRLTDYATRGGKSIVAGKTCANLIIGRRLSKANAVQAVGIRRMPGRKLDPQEHV